MPGRSILSPFGERIRAGRDDAQLVSRGVVVESGPAAESAAGAARRRAALARRRRRARGGRDGHRRRAAAGELERERAADPRRQRRAAARPTACSAARPARCATATASPSRPATTRRAARCARARRCARRCGARRRRAASAGSPMLARPIGGAHGTSRQGVVCTFADVTSTVEAERRLREERDRAQRYLEVASTLVVGARLAGPRRADQPPGLRAARLRGARAARA